jgi:hypothetical protein
MNFKAQTQKSQDSSGKELKNLQKKAQYPAPSLVMLRASKEQAAGRIWSQSQTTNKGSETRCSTLSLLDWHYEQSAATRKQEKRES